MMMMMMMMMMIRWWSDDQIFLFSWNKRVWLLCLLCPVCVQLAVCASPMMRHMVRCGLRSAAPQTDHFPQSSVVRNKYFLSSHIRFCNFFSFHSFGAEVSFSPSRDGALIHIATSSDGWFLNRNQSRTPLNCWPLWWRAAATASVWDHWTGAESRLHISKYARNWSALARRPLHPHRDNAVVMFNTSGIEFTFNKKEDISEVINGTLELLYNVLVNHRSHRHVERVVRGAAAGLRRPEKIIIGVMLAIITAVTVMGNTLVVIAVCVVKKLRQPSNYLLVSLAVADLSVAIVVMPFVIVNGPHRGKWLFGEVFCNIFIGMGCNVLHCLHHGPCVWSAWIGEFTSWQQLDRSCSGSVLHRHRNYACGASFGLNDTETTNMWFYCCYKPLSALRVGNSSSVQMKVRIVNETRETNGRLYTRWWLLNASFHISCFWLYVRLKPLMQKMNVRRLWFIYSTIH